ncbi:hypothetical protein CAEBREN_07841 [Caenorhabditis brenneri]|uniref:CUB-like domain-containing protein n=1 Tax=Caenorhabditis brenneri TaxID=135651 RepID=G0NSW0_CAEBE|nr:hypothetical protein CAEBREN_07841 [Caenorhabditis brenneri]
MYIVLFAVLCIAKSLALDCDTIQDADIYDNNTINLPKIVGPLPSKFNCTYQIKAPANSTYGFSAHVSVENFLKGANDYALIIDVDGTTTRINNRTTGSPFVYNIIPGAQISIQLVTKSVVMNSEFLIEVTYHEAIMPTVKKMATGGVMNFFDLNTLSDGKHYFNGITYTGNEQIQAYLAAFSDKKFTGCWDCYVMDGTVEKHSKIYRIAMFEDPTFASTFNAITVFAATEKTLKMVFNPLSEARQFSSLWATESKMSVSIYASPANTQAIEVVNFNSTGITLEDLYINSEICIAYIESGPPNIASRRLLDLSSNPNIPYFFNEKYFTVVIKNCFLEFRMK